MVYGYIKRCRSAFERKRKKKYIADEIEHLLNAVDLLDVSNRKISALSGGMKQRLALSQAVLGSSKILIFDEPTAGLDPTQRISIRNYISRIAFNIIVIIATHAVSDIEYIAREVIMLKKGLVVAHAPPAKLLEKMEGKVWSIPVIEDNIPKMQKEYQVTNINSEESNGEIFLHVLFDARPMGNAQLAHPNLKDNYLYVFGGQQSS